MIVMSKPGILERLLLRPAEAQDREAILAMYEKFEPKGASLGLPPRYDLEGWLARLAGYYNLVAELDGRVIGHGVLCGDNGSAEVAVFIHQEFRGAGLGRRLLSALVREASRAGFHRVWGVTEYDNIPMLRLARSLGFVRGEDAGEFYLDFAAEVPAGPVTSAA
jgi:L-amino acid N-acyltransferase YncA